MLVPPSSDGGLSLREPDAKGRFLAVSTVSPAISGRVLTCAITAATAVQNIAESLCIHPYGVEHLPPKFMPNPPVAGLHKLGFHPAPIALGLVNRLDVSEDWAYVLLD